MARYTKEELLKKAAPYFSQGEKVMYATEDGNFFYDSHKNHSFNHSKQAKIALHKLEVSQNETIIEEEEFEDIQDTDNEKPRRGRKPLNKE